LDYVPEADIGDYTIIHVGFAISKVSEEEAQETLKIIREIADIGEELALAENEQNQIGTTG
jgi:hydrogenase expression/formation protein HypC